MSTGDSAVRRGRTWKRWATPAFAVAAGLVYLVASLRSGDRGVAFSGLGVMVALAVAVVLLSRRSETVAGLLDRRDERINTIDRDATVFAGMTLILAVLTGFVVELAQGQDGQPYALLGAIAAVAYIGALIVLRLRH